MAAIYSVQDQFDAMTAANAAADGEKVATFLALWQTRLGNNPALALYRNGTQVWSTPISGQLPIVGNAFVVPAGIVQASSVDADIDLGSWELRIENASNKAIYYGATVTKAGGTDIISLSDDLVTDSTVTTGVITFTAPTLDTVTETISRNDSRVYMWTDPNLPFAQNTKPPNGSTVYVQLTDALKGRVLTSLPEPGVIGSGSDYQFARLTDPDDGAKKSYFHQVSSAFPSWSGSYRAAYNSGADIVEGLKDGQAYWCCYEIKITPSMVTTSQPAGLFDVHHNNWDTNPEYRRPTFFGRAPIQILLQTDSKYRIDVFGNYDIGAVASQVKTEIVHTSPTLVAGDIHQFVFKFRVGTSWADQPFLQVWRRINGGATTQIVNRSNVELSYYDVPPDTHYLKPGLYQWVSTPSTMSMYTKGFQAFKDAAGTPEIVPDVLFNLMDSL